MKIKEITLEQLDEFNSRLVLERFENNIWLKDRITEKVEELLKSNHWDPRLFYATILNDIITSVQFSQTHRLFRHLKVYSNIVVTNTPEYVDGAKASYHYTITPMNENRIDGITFELVVGQRYPINKKKLISDLDSVIGHEINHVIQRSKQERNKFYPPSMIDRIMSKRHEMDYARSLHYNDFNKEEEDIVSYFLKKTEFDSYAYSIGIWLDYQYGGDAKKVLNELFFDMWKGKIKPIYQNQSPNIKIIDLLSNFLYSFKKSQLNGTLKGGLSAKKLWKKLAKEIYRYLVSRNNNKKFDKKSHP